MVIDNSYMLAFGLSVPTARLAIASQAKTVQLPVQASAHWVEAPRGLAGHGRAFNDSHYVRRDGSLCQSPGFPMDGVFFACWSFVAQRLSTKVVVALRAVGAKLYIMKGSSAIIHRQSVVIHAMDDLSPRSVNRLHASKFSYT